MRCREHFATEDYADKKLTKFSIFMKDVRNFQDEIIVTLFYWLNCNAVITGGGQKKRGLDVFFYLADYTILTILIRMNVAILNTRNQTPFRDEERVDDSLGWLAVKYCDNKQWLIYICSHFLLGNWQTVNCSGKFTIRQSLYDTIDVDVTNPITSRPLVR